MKRYISIYMERSINYEVTQTLYQCHENDRPNASAPPICTEARKAEAHHLKATQPIRIHPYAYIRRPFIS
jgi:hypothetical protein